MKFWSAVLLLLLQAKPAWGLVLCMGLGAADAGQMEAGCAMADQPSANAAAVASSHPSAGDASSRRAHGNGHSCMLADMCTLVTQTTSPKTALLVIPATQHGATVWPSDNVQGQEHRAPPTPPPNA